MENTALTAWPEYRERATEESALLKNNTVNICIPPGTLSTIPSFRSVERRRKESALNTNVECSSRLVNGHMKAHFMQKVQRANANNAAFAYMAKITTHGSHSRIPREVRRFLRGLSSPASLCSRARAHATVNLGR